MDLLSGDHNGSAIPVKMLVSRLASPPLTGMMYKLGAPSRELIISRDFPSGENRGELSPFAAYVSWRAFAPSISINQICPIRLARARSVSVTTYTTDLPSGEIWASERDLMR